MKSLPKRSDVVKGDTWDLESLFATDADWDEALIAWGKRIPLFRDYVGTLAESPEQLAKCLAFDLEIDREADRLGTYAHLRMSEDTAATPAQRMTGRFQHAATKAGELASFLQPEIMAIEASVLEEW
ncbi:MAG: oligoendopeptidase F, partial [Planctomycetaceae bacterium]|nr:oligoendopeptidase F [Planctomycetaceae bacterium]